MKTFTLLMLTLFCLNCNTNKQISLNEKETNMITQLTEIKKEDKFVEGSNGWEGYSGCKNPEEKKAYSDNINILIDKLIEAIKEKKDNSYMANLIDEYSIKSEELGEKFRADTDESEMQYFYFERIKKIFEIL